MANAPLDRDVLASIGTDALIAFGYTELQIRQWRRRGVSWQERAKVQRLATERGVEVPPNFLEKRRPAPTPAKRAGKRAARRKAA